MYSVLIREQRFLTEPLLRMQGLSVLNHMGKLNDTYDK
jgi:hypothetical protein